VYRLACALQLPLQLNTIACLHTLQGFVAHACCLVLLPLDSTAAGLQPAVT
jgi:hypothetical protein